MGLNEKLNRFRRMEAKSEKIKSGDRRDKSGYFAIRSILLSIFSCLAAVAGKILFGHTDSLLGIFIWVVIVGLFLCAVILAVWALINLVFQFGINRNGWSWIALILFIASLAASAFLVIYL